MKTTVAALSLTSLTSSPDCNGPAEESLTSFRFSVLVPVFNERQVVEAAAGALTTDVLARLLPAYFLFMS